ncbi:MAG: NADH-quinone oxidoreductase subunit NuoE [Gammaproteobacteria bacterium]|nr:NADH-quinone oxidoreductase subunit NuoE [Gammaproteobacteria bacterium]MCP4475717.1 NADH-quinone oxidoreductase subunit NuoE [Gammaproteobacteria bacterium]
MTQTKQSNEKAAHNSDNVALNDPVKNAIDEELKKYPPEQKQSALLAALRFAQEQHQGQLTEALIIAVADYLAVPSVSAFEVATFYSLYDLKPVGRHKVNLCNSISCMLCGAKALTAHIHERYAVAPGETTADGKFTFKEVTCLGACVGGPAVRINNSYHENITSEKLDKLIDELE